MLLGCSAIFGERVAWHMTQAVPTWLDSAGILQFGTQSPGILGGRA